VHVTVKLTVSSGELVTVLDENVESQKELEAVIEIVKLTWGLEKSIIAFLEAKGRNAEG